jgi:hypothetical protein
MNCIVRSGKIYAFALMAVILTGLGAAGCFGPKPTAFNGQPVLAQNDPVQTAPATAQPVHIQVDNGDFTLTPQADYRVEARVVSKRNYSTGWAGQLVPVDLALAWGKLIEPECIRKITYSQNQRWYYFRYSRDTPVDGRYIAAHSSNHHLIPGTSNILKAIRKVKTGQLIVLEGCLVNIHGVKDARDFWWNSSLSRTDTGAGACELLYVTKVQLDQYFYQ